MNKKESKRSKEHIEDSINELKGNINSVLDSLDFETSDMVPSSDILQDIPGLIIEQHDYEKDIEIIKIDAKETLESLANLYLSEETMKTKNVYRIIKDDSISLSKLNFSIECAQSALISCMKQIDCGMNDPEMYQSIAMFQKEMRDTIKLTYDLQKKMKDFYKELKHELAEIDVGEETPEATEDNYTTIGDPKMLNDIIKKFKENPDQFDELVKGM